MKTNGLKVNHYLQYIFSVKVDMCKYRSLEWKHKCSMVKQKSKFYSEPDLTRIICSQIPDQLLDNCFL